MFVKNKFVRKLFYCVKIYLDILEKVIMKKKSIILLSGGLDSLVTLGIGIKEYNIKLALTFNYGQK